MQLSTFFDLDRVTDLLRSDCRDLITEVVEIKPLSQERPTAICCIYQRYDDDYTCLRQLKLYKKLNFNLLVVSNSAVCADLRAALSLVVNVLIIRENVGYDFAAYRCGVIHLKTRLESVKNFVIICNDSCLGPYQNEEVFSLLSDSEEFLLKGMTDSYGGGHYHLQSYWLLLTSPLFNSELFDGFVSRIKNLRSKKQVIASYEVGLSKFMLHNGIKLLPLFPYAGIPKGSSSDKRFLFKKSKNPTIHFGLEMFLNQKFPFLKKELLIRNIGIVEGLELNESNFREVVEYLNNRNKIARKFLER